MTDHDASDEPLVHVTRGGVVESVHAGHLVVVGPDGDVTLSVGDAGAVVYARSALKPLQLAGLLDAGLWPGGVATDDDARRRALALACASHSGEAVHLDGVRAVLAAAGLDEGALLNTPDQPVDLREAALRIAAGTAPSSLAQNCSGKHAAMLTACAVLGRPTRDYLDADGPVQAAALVGVADRAPLVGGPGDRSVDGCGTVLPLVALADLARAYGRLAGAGGGADARVAAAMRAHPYLVGGRRRESTAAMTAGAGAGVVAKDGAEGVFALALADGRAAAWKVSDGAVRAHAALAGAVLAHLGVDAAGPAGPGGAPLEPDEGPVLGDQPVLGHGSPVGAVTLSPVLAALLGPASPR